MGRDAIRILDEPSELSHFLFVHAQEVLHVRTSTSTAASGLNPKDVIENEADKVVVQVAIAQKGWALDHERENGQLWSLHWAQHDHIVHIPDSLPGHIEQFLLSGHDVLGPNVLLDVHHQSSSDGFDNRWRSTFLAILDFLDNPTITVIASMPNYILYTET